MIIKKLLKNLNTLEWTHSTSNKLQTVVVVAATTMKMDVKALYAAAACVCFLTLKECERV